MFIQCEFRQSRSLIKFHVPPSFLAQCFPNIFASLQSLFQPIIISIEFLVSVSICNKVGNKMNLKKQQIEFNYFHAGHCRHHFCFVRSVVQDEYSLPVQTYQIDIVSTKRYPAPDLSPKDYHINLSLFGSLSQQCVDKMNIVRIDPGTSLLKLLIL